MIYENRKSMSPEYSKFADQLEQASMFEYSEKSGVLDGER